VQLPAQRLHEAGERGVVTVARPSQIAVFGTFGGRVAGPQENLAHER